MKIWYTYTVVINPDLIAGVINWLSNQVYQGKATKLKFILSSSGGDIDSAIRLYDYLKALPFEVETIDFRQIDSAANVIFLAGTKRFAVKDCRFFLHEGIFNIGNPAAALHIHEETLNLLREINRRHVEILVRELSKRPQEIKKILREGKVFNAKSAKDFGLVHEIINKLPVVQQSTQGNNP